MAKLTKHKLLNLLNTTIPQPDRITHVDETTHADAVTFRWRGLPFKVTTSLDVTEDFGTHGHSLLMQALLRETHAHQ